MPASSGGGRAAFVALNVVGGAAVLASYAAWLGDPARDPGALWGTIDGTGRTLYTLSMLAAAAGYFAFAPFLLRHGDHPPLSFPRVNLLLTLVLLPSALWMPLAFAYLDAPSPQLWWTMRAGLAITGLASAATARVFSKLSPKSCTMRLFVLSMYSSPSFTRSVGG